MNRVPWSLFALLGRPPRQAQLLAIGISLSSALASVACEPAVVLKTASGEQVVGVSYEEQFALSSGPREVTFHGDRLRRVAEMMDRDGVIAMAGSYEASGVIDKSILTITVTARGDRERKLVLKNCAEPHVCAFFAEAVGSGLVSRMPGACRDAVACTKK